ncbi:MAG: mannose-6-phosphate isomerase, class I [Leptonema sp. (in: bacteria)]
MTSEKPLYYKIIPTIQSYPWGNSTENGYIKNFIKKKYKFLLGEKSFAELWMGAHKKSPSLVFYEESKEKDSLNSLISKNSEHFLGKDSLENFNKKLPFLFKILDIEKPLSIQAHPDKSLAKILHKRNPEWYPDENHKPELAICLKDFQALIGFRTQKELIEIYKNTPIKNFIEISHSNHFVKEIYQKIMLLQSEQIEALTESFIDFLKINTIEKFRDDWFFVLLNLNGKKDPGIFGIYLLNYLELQPDEGIFIKPHTIHAYLKGAVLECMADSDNVVRGGLTTKPKDIEVLLTMLDYDIENIPIYKPTLSTEGYYYYDIPVQDFKVLLLHHPKYEFLNKIVLKEFPQILLILEGSLEMEFISPIIKKAHLGEAGEIYFLPGDLKERGIKIQLKPSIDSLIYSATINKNT